VAVAVAALLLAGWAMALAEHGCIRGDSFFEYRIRQLDGVPAWFVAAIILVLLNGWNLCRRAINRTGSETPGEFRDAAGSRGASDFALNLVAIPALLVAFLVVRALGW
jgi:hypothetical protein